MGIIIPFVSAGAAPAFRHPPIRLTLRQVTESIREKLEYTAEVFAEHEEVPVPGWCGTCGCPTCEGYRHLLLNPAVQRILLELFA